MEIRIDIVKQDIKTNIYLNICKYILDKNYDSIKESYNILLYLDENLYDDDYFLTYCHMYLCLACEIDDSNTIKLLFELYDDRIDEIITYWDKRIYRNIMDDFEHAMNNKWDKEHTYISFKNNFYFIDIYYCLSLIIDNDNLDIFKIFCEKNITKYISEEHTTDCIDGPCENNSSKSKIKKW